MENTRKLNRLLDIVCEYRDIPKDIVLSKSRIGKIAMARQEYCYFARVFFKKRISYDEIGSLISRDHATALHAFRKISGMEEVEREYAKSLNQMKDYVYQKMNEYLSTGYASEPSHKEFVRLRQKLNEETKKVNTMYYFIKDYLVKTNEVLQKDRTMEGYLRKQMDKKYWETIQKLNEFKNG